MWFLSTKKEGRVFIPSPLFLKANANYAARRLRPRARRALIILRPSLVDMRFKKPCFLLRGPIVRLVRNGHDHSCTDESL